MTDSQLTRSSVYNLRRKTCCFTSISQCFDSNRHRHFRLSLNAALGTPGTQSCAEVDLHPHSGCLCCSGLVERRFVSLKGNLTQKLLEGQSAFTKRGSIMTARTQGAAGKDKPAPKSRATGNSLGLEMVMWSGTWEYICLP